MSQTPQKPDDDLRLSDEEIRARSQGMRRQYISSEERGMAGAVGSVVAGGIESVIRRLLLLLRIPLILVGGLLGFFLLNGRDGVSFWVALAAGVVGAVIGAALINATLRFIDLRGYRRNVR